MNCATFILWTHAGSSRSMYELEDGVKRLTQPKSFGVVRVRYSYKEIVKVLGVMQMKDRKSFCCGR